MSDSPFVYRSPILPLSELVHTSEELITKFSSLLLRDALYIASPDLYQELLNYENGVVKDQHKREKLFIGLYKYYTRMCTRSTPFGIFAGLHTGRFGDSCSTELPSELQPKLRLDMDYLCNLYYELNKDESLYPYLIFYPNNSLYKVQHQWRYIEYQFKSNSERFHNLVSVDDNEVLSTVIKVAANGASLEQLIAVIAEFELEREDIIPYLSLLIQNQILTSNLYPGISGTEYQERLFNVLESTPDKRFENMSETIASIFNSSGTLRECVKNAENFLQKLNIKIISNHFVQVDLLKVGNSFFLPTSIKTQASAAVGILAQLKKINRHEHALTKFRTAFYERYEDAFMPLALVMDTDLGTGYRNAVCTTRPQPTVLEMTRNKKLLNLKLSLYSRAMAVDSAKVEISDDDLQALSNERPDPVSGTCSLMGQVFRNSDGELNLKVKSAGGIGGIHLLGRFGHLHKDIEQICIDYAKADQNQHPGAILAEVVHLPQGRIGNVVTRPLFRQYEIPYLSFSNLNEENQILVDDLWVGVVQSRVVLFSKKHNKEVIPRLGNAHNYSLDSLPVYHFLCDIQAQQLNSAVYWSWDEISDMEFLPAVYYGNIMLSPAKWNLNTDLFKKLSYPHDIDIINALLKEKNIPSKIVVAQGDNELFLDLTTDLGCKTFLKQCRSTANLTLEEFIFTECNSIGGYANEIIIPLVFPETIPYEGLALGQLKAEKTVTFNPLSEWVYFKLFTGKKHANQLLTTSIPMLIDMMKEYDMIDKWFFVRYANPHEHIRLRFRLKKAENRMQLEKIAGQLFMMDSANGLIWNMELATYRRELDRYGSSSMEMSESWFSYNSDLVISLLPSFSKLSNPKQISAIIYYFDKLIDQCGYSREEKLAIVINGNKGYCMEFGVDSKKELKKRLDTDFRDFHPSIRTWLSGGELSNDEEAVKFKLSQNLCATQELMNDLQQMYCDNKPKLSKIIGSYIHMFMNRLFMQNQRFSEMMLYYHMERYLISEQARTRKAVIQLN